MILASISTLESAGIQDSGSSTRSWIGILWDAVITRPFEIWEWRKFVPLADNGVVLHATFH